MIILGFLVESLGLFRIVESPGGNFLAFCEGKMFYGSTTINRLEDSTGKPITLITPFKLSKETLKIKFF